MLVTDEMLEFENELVQVQDFKKITDHFRGIFENISRIKNEKSKDAQKMSTCNP